MEPLPSPEEPTHEDEAEFNCAMEVLIPALQGYVRSLLPDRDAVDDVVQETCLFMWEQRHRFHGEKLRPAAFRIAWFKALSYRRDRQREQLVHFSEEALQRVAGAAEELAAEADQRLHALRLCLAKLSSGDLALLRLKYLDRDSMARHARARQMSPNRMQKALSRLRLALRHCIRATLSDAP
ncbi:MAG: sigma-70 family RNA polymerase sigma factor [Luteolibacter sp.]